jgi:hypothetical protein
MLNELRMTRYEPDAYMQVLNSRERWCTLGELTSETMFSKYFIPHIVILRLLHCCKVQ